MNTGRLMTSRRSRGQAAVLMALCLFSLVVFLAMATNMGILVNDRTRMQNTADLSAYSGAFEQARLMNLMSRINRRIALIAKATRVQLTCKDAPQPSEIIPDLSGDEEELPDTDCDISRPRWRDHRFFLALGCDEPKTVTAYLNVQQGRMDLLAHTFMAENFRGKGTPLRAATFTAFRNFRGLGGPRHTSFYEQNMLSPTYRAMPPTEMVPVRRATTQFDYFVFRQYGRCDCRSRRGCIEHISKRLDTWFIKAHTAANVFFPVRVNGVPLKNFLDIENFRGGYFGGDAERGITGSDMLWSFAVAKPYGGHLSASCDYGPDMKCWNGVPQTVEFPFFMAKFENVFDYRSFDAIPEEWGGLPMEQRFIPTYRARMAGVHEPMIDSLMGEPLRPVELMLSDLYRANRDEDAGDKIFH